MLEKHNSNRVAPFLLGRCLFYVIVSVEEREGTLERMPVLARRPAEARIHFEEASAKAKALASLVRKGPQPLIALAAHDDVREAATLFQPCPIVQSPNQSEATVRLDWLLDKAAASLDSVAKKIPRARQHRKSTATTRNAKLSELQRLTASVLVTAFRKKLNHPYHSHVATVVTALTGIVTDADYVKKVEKRHARAFGGQNS
jgi:hypothetical protein